MINHAGDYAKWGLHLGVGNLSHSNTAVMIGNFDGVHLGHRALIEMSRSTLGVGGRLIALAFNPHPLERLNPGIAPSPIEPFPVRCDRLRAAGVDEVHALDPTPELLGQSPERFVDHVIDQYQPSLIVEGHDFHFGHRREGTPALLRELCQLRGVDAVIVGPVEVALTDQSIVTASSSITRWLLGNGRVRDAGFVLGRPHELLGMVVEGDRLGRTIGFRTANIATDSMLPRDGVYAGIVTMPCGTRVGGAINIGARPTVQGTQRRAEVHLIERDGSALQIPPSTPEYGWAIGAELIGWVRDEVRFDSIEVLKGQLERDVRRIAAMVDPMLSDAGMGVSV